MSGIPEWKMEKIRHFKELIKEGKSIRNALRESKLAWQDYKKYKDLIWCDPEMEQYRPKDFDPSVCSGPHGSGDEGKGDESGRANI